MREHMEKSALFSHHGLKHFSYGEYEIWCLEHLHLLFVNVPSEVTYYLPLTPSEYTILWRLLRVPAPQTVTFEELLPQCRDLPRQTLAQVIQRHVCRLKKKLPPCWNIVCENRFGYRLQLISPLRYTTVTKVRSW